MPYSTLIWTDPITKKTGGGDFAAGLAEPVTQSLAPYLAPRSDNTLTSTKVDAIRLPMAAKQKDVRLRFYQLGNCSWWWGVDNLAFYDILAPTTAQTTPPPHIDSIIAAGGNITVKWSNGGTTQSLSFTPAVLLGPARVTAPRDLRRSGHWERKVLPRKPLV